MNTMKMKKAHIREFMRKNYTDERLAWLLAPPIEMEAYIAS